MKQNKVSKFFPLLLIAALLFTGTKVMPVEAGSSDIIIDETSYTEKLDNTVWNNPDGDIVVKDKTLVFTDNSSEYTRLITKTAVKATAEVKEVVNVQSTLQFTKLPKGKTFALALGIKKIESLQGDKGNIEISFVNKEGLSASLIYYNEEGDAKELGKAINCGSLSGKISIDVSVNQDKILTAVINGKQAWKVELPVSGEGRVGFLQTGSCGVKISNVKIISHLYDSPENCNIEEDFETGGFNANLLTSKMQSASNVCWPSGTGIEEYEGSKVFRYTNAGETYMGTKYTYSNFEISFDVPHLQRKNILDEEGNLVTSASNRFGISYGGVASDYDYVGYTDGVTDVIWFTNYSTITSMKSGEVVDAATLGYPFFSKECDKGFSVKMKMEDSVVTVYMKWIDESKYKEIFKYQLSTNTPTGYLHIWSSGPSSMAIDNLKIVNTDINPKLVDVDFKTSIIEGPGDYDYQPMEKIYETKEKKEGFDWYLVLLIVAAVCVISLSIIANIVITKNKKRGEGDANETQ